MIMNLMACKKLDDNANSLKNESVGSNLKIKNYLNFKFESDEELLEYLVGDWKFKSLNFSNNAAYMKIDKDLGLKISFDDSMKNIQTGYLEVLREQGQIIIHIEKKTYKYDFEHKTFYDGKFLMGLYHTGEEEHLFDILVDSYGRDSIDEILFEKDVDIVYKSTPKKDSKFKGVIWGYDNIDDVDKFWIGEVDGNYKITDGISNLYEFSKELDDETKALYYITLSL